MRGGEPDNGLLPFICRLNKKEDVDDEANWPMANPSLPYLPNLLEEIRKEYREWKKNPRRLPAFMTKRMNIPENAEEMSVTDWENIAATNIILPCLERWSCTCGVDYTKLNDWASVDLHFRDGDQRYDISHSWMCLQSNDMERIKAPWKEWADMGRLTLVDENEIHPSVITEYIQQAKKKYNIKKLAVDSCFTNQWFNWGDAPELRWATNNAKLIRHGRKPGKEDDADMGNFVYGKIEAKSRKTDPFMALVAAMTIEDELPQKRPKPTPATMVYSY